MHKLAWFGVILLILIVGFTDRVNERTHPPGQIAPHAPVQMDVKGLRPWKKNGYLIRPLAQFSITARALMVDHYRFDRESELSPLDISFGWGPMSDTQILSALSLSHSHRHFSWRTRDLPIDSAEINSHAANMHMIPADDYAEITLKKVIPGDIVSIEGYLVEAARADGFNWRSSLSRDDTGDGACEVVWVEKIRIR